MNKLKLEYQYFEGCPNHERMLNNLEAAIKGLEDRMELTKVLIEDIETARRISFRGSPTLLVEGEDIEGMQEPVSPALSCRYYQKGIPTAEEIRNKILLKLNKE